MAAAPQTLMPRTTAVRAKAFMGRVSLWVRDKHGPAKEPFVRCSRVFCGYARLVRRPERSSVVRCAPYAGYFCAAQYRLGRPLMLLEQLTSQERHRAA